MGVEAAAGVVLQKVWSFDRHLGVVELAPNTFLVEVSSSGTRDRASDLLVLKQWSPGLSWQEINMDLCPVWVQIDGVPMDHSNALTAQYISNAIGEFWKLRVMSKRKFGACRSSEYAIYLTQQRLSYRVIICTEILYPPSYFL